MNHISGGSADSSHTEISRRDMLARLGSGYGMVGLAAVLADELVAERRSARAADTAPAAAPAGSPLSPKSPHYEPKARRVIHLFMNGGPSQVDTFDPKPSLTKYHGKTLPGEYLKTERRTGAAFKSPYTFQKYGQSGIEVSEIFAKTAENVDDMCIIRSMHANVPNHEPS